jgi:hypothetical protein
MTQCTDRHSKLPFSQHARLQSHSESKSQPKLQFLRDIPPIANNRTLYTNAVRTVAADLNIPAAVAASRDDTHIANVHSRRSRHVDVTEDDSTVERAVDVGSGVDVVGSAC